MSTQTYRPEVMKRGLCINTLYIQGENGNDYHDLFQGFLEDLKPVNTIELALVQEMAECYWLRERALRFQGEAFQIMLHKEEPKAAPRELLVLIRYQSSNERSFHRALETLQKIQKQRLKQTKSPKPQFVSQIISEPVAQAAPNPPEPEPRNT
jgi:hypothetical protein